MSHLTLSHIYRWQSAFNIILYYVAFGTDRWQLSFDIIWHYVVSHLAYVPLWYDSMIWRCVVFGIGGEGIEVEFPSVMF